MSEAEEFVEAFLERYSSVLMHYASEYYDPVKAREYYLRTRELKGRQSTSGLTVKGDKAGNEERKQAWAYTKNQIALAKKGELQKAAEDRKSFVERARQLASERREQISDKLASLLETLTEQRSARSEDISAEKEFALDQQAAQQKARSDQLRRKAEAQISALPKIPEGIPEARRAQLVAQREVKIAQIRGTLNRDLSAVATEGAREREAIAEATDDDRSALAAYTQGQREKERTSATASREEVSTELKATVDNARADYENLKAQITSRFEETSQREYDTIRGNLPAEQPSSTKKSSGKAKDKKGGKPKSKSSGKGISLEEAAKKYVQRHRENSK
jgi:hypothetical protein